jgi:hypothetical protein
MSLLGQIMLLLDKTLPQTKPDDDACFGKRELLRGQYTGFRIYSSLIAKRG